MASPRTASRLPETMRGCVRTRRGAVRDVLALAFDLAMPPTPDASSDDVLIRVRYVGLQFNSAFVMRVMPTLPFSGAWIPELELSGDVVAAGGRAPPELRDAGTRVVAFQTALGYALGRGVLCEYVRLPARQVVRLDDDVDLAAASGVVGAGCTALKMVRTADVRGGQRVLVNGASSSVGAVLVQLCKAAGAHVVGVASGANEAMVRGLGVDDFVDYRRHDPLPAYLAVAFAARPLDLVLDCVGLQALFAHAPAYLRPGGAVVNIGSTVDGPLRTLAASIPNMYLPTCLGGVPRRYVMFSTPPDHDDVVRLARLLAQRRIRVPVDSLFALDDALHAYERVATRRARGKVVIKVCGD